MSWQPMISISKFKGISILSVCIFILSISTVCAIRCWVCRSDSDPKCADPFDNSTLPISDCNIVTLNHLQEYGRPMKSTMCRKIRQKVNGNWRTIRNCAFLGQPGEGTGNEHHCLTRQGTHDIYMEYCTCNSKDGCNSANHIKMPYLLIMVPIAFLLTLLSCF